EDEGPQEVGRRRPESCHTDKLAPEVKRAQEAEALAERHARLAAQTHRQREGRAIVQEQRSPLPRRRGRRQQEDRAGGLVLAVAFVRRDLEAPVIRPHPFEAVETFCPRRPLEALRGRADGDFGYVLTTGPSTIPA